MTSEYVNTALEMPIISVHVPKTAGITLLHVLKRTLGPDAVFADYADDPCHPASQRNLDPEGYFSHPTTFPTGYNAVHGHFHIGKYANVSPAFRMTFIRNPVDTMLSIHSFWQTFGYGHNALHDYFLKNKLNVFETARLPLLRHMLSRSYFGSVNMKEFDFIGRYESFAVDTKRLSSKLGIPLVADIHLNQLNTEILPCKAEDSPRTRSLLRDILIDDVRFYDDAISLEPR